MVNQRRPSARCAFRHLAGARGSAELQSAASSDAGRIPAGLRGAAESRLPIGLPGRQLCHPEGTSRRLRCLLGRTECGRRRARPGLLGFLPGPRGAEASVPRRVVSGTTAGRCDRQGVCGFLPGEQDEWRTERDSGNQVGKEWAKVIKNEKQYRITKAQIRQFQDAVAELAGQARPSNIRPRLWEAQREAARSQMEELREQVEAYERLNAGRSKEVVLEAVEDLPKALIRARIAAGMTQEGLARRLGVKPQQVQRYEATEYESASFARILKVVQALGLSMPRAVRLVRNG